MPTLLLGIKVISLLDICSAWGVTRHANHTVESRSSFYLSAIERADSNRITTKCMCFRVRPVSQVAGGTLPFLLPFSPSLSYPNYLFRKFPPAKRATLQMSMNSGYCFLSGKRIVCLPAFFTKKSAATRCGMSWQATGMLQYLSGLCVLKIVCHSVPVYLGFKSLCNEQNQPGQAVFKRVRQKKNSVLRSYTSYTSEWSSFRLISLFPKKKIYIITLLLRQE